MRSRINVFDHNKKIENRIKSREAIIKEEFGGKSGDALAKEINKRMAMEYILDSDFKKKYIEFGKDTTILGSKYVEDAVNKYAPINGIKQTYDDIRPMFNFVNNIGDHLKSKQTGNELILNAIELNTGINYSKISTKANMSVTSLNKTYDNFKNAKEFFVFDTETLSGMGKTGYNELDSMQEIAFRKFKKIDGKLVEDEVSRMETLIGITQKQYDEYMDIFVNNFNENGWQGNQKYEVIAGRFAKLGHKDTVIKNAGKGLAITESFASDASENLMDVSNIKRGLERALELGKRQDAERLANGLMVWEDQLLRSINIFNENFVAGFNSTNFDFEKMNQSVATVWSRMNSSQKAEYSKILNLKNGVVPVINPTEGNYLDFRDVVRTATESIGKTGIYGNDDKKLKKIKDIGKTLLQQESLGEVFAKDAMFTAAHTAGADVTTLAHLIGGNELNGTSLFDELMTTINKNASAITGKVDYNSVLMATQGEFFNDFTRKGALNFTTDRSSGAIRTFNGISLDANGDVRDLGKFGKATGIKKDVAYKIGFMGEMDMSEDWVKKISGIHQDYAQGKLWVAKFNPLIDKSIAGDNSILEDPTTYFFTSKEAMEGFVSSHFAHVGNIGVDGKIEDLADPAARAEVQKLFGVHTIKDGKVSEVATQTASELVSNGTKQAMNDPAARMIRENEYTKAVKFQRMQDYLKKNGAATIDEQKKMLSLATAENVAGGKSLKIKHDVLSILGFQDRNVNKQVLYSSTLNNTINSYEYMASRRNAIDTLVDAVKGYGEIGSEQQQFIYDSLMRGLKEDAAKAIASGDLEKEALINGSSSLKVYAKDLNYFEFDMPEDYFKNTNAKAMPGEIDNVLRVNLKTEKEYSLVNDLLRRRRGSDDRLKSPNARQAYGMQELRNFVKEVSSMENYNGMFDGIDMTSDIGVDAMSEKLIQAMKDFREDNPTAGFSKDRVMQDVLGSDELLSTLDDDFIRKSIENTKGNLANLKMLDTSNKNEVKSYVEDLVDNILMPTVKDSDGNLIKDIDDIVTFAQKTYGYNETTAKLFKYNLQMQREEHVKGMTNLVESVTKHGGLISYDTAKSQMGMTIGGETYNLWGMPKTKFENGVLYAQTGQTRVASGFKLDVQDAIEGNRFSPGKVAIKSDLSDAYKELRFLNYKLERAAARGDDLGKTVIGAVSNVASKARELSALGSMTTKDSYAWQGLDLSEGILSMPHMLDEIKSYTGWQDDDFVRIIDRNKKRILNGNVSSEVKEAFAKNKQDVVKMLLGIGAGNENKQRSVQEFILGNISNYTKDGKLSEGRAMVGEYSPMAMTEWDNPSRPPISSADEILFNKKKLDEIINDPTKGLKGRIETGSRIVSTRQNAKRVFDGVGEVATGVTFKNASISEKKFKEIVSDKFNEELEKLDPNSSKAEWLNSLRRQMSGLNLTEQGKIIDGRVADALLSGTETQTINTFKNFSRDIKNNTKIMQERVKKAMPTIEIAKSGEIVFKLGKKDYVKRGDALFAIDGYGDVLDTIGVKEDAGLFGFGYNSKGSNLAVGEDEISKLLNKNKDKILNADGTINQTKAMQLLNESFDSGFYVKNAFVKGYNKGTIEYAEKGMYDALVSGAGTLDSRVNKLLEAVGMEEARGKVLSEDFIDLLAEKYSGLTEKQRKSLGFADGWSQVKEAINKEKFAKTDFIREIEAFKDVVAFSNDNIIKHGNAGISMKGLINNITEKYMIDDKLSYEKAAEKTIETLKDFEVFNGVDVSFKDGKIHFGEIKNSLEATIDRQAVQKMTDELGIYGKDSPFAILDSEGNIVGYKTTLTTAFNEDFSGTSRSSISRDKIKKELKEKREKLRALDPESNSVSYNALNEEVKNLEHSYRAAKNYNKTMTISSRETDMMNLYEYDESKMAKVREKLGGDYNKIYERMLDEDGRINSEYAGRAIHQGFLDDIEDKAYEQAVENKKYFDSAKNAITYNNRPGLGTDFVKDNNFEEVKIGDLVIPNGHDTKFLESDPNRSFGRNLLIDTGLSGNDKYVAISATNYSITGDDVNTDEVQKSLAKLQRASKTLEDGRKGINGALDNGTTVKDLEVRVKNAADELKESVVGSMRKTIGGLDSVQLGGYSYEKATMAMLDPSSLKKAMKNGIFDEEAWDGYNMYAVSKVNGKTLAEWADKGVHYDASWHGMQYFKDLGYFDKSVWKDKYGMESVDDMIEHLRVNGTAGLELRTPTIKEGSMSVTRQFLDTDLKDGQAKATAPLVFGRNQDHDGDSIIQAELKHKDWSLVDYEMGMKNNPNNVPEDVKRYYEEFNAAQTYRASIINDKIFENVAVPTYQKDIENAVKNVNTNEVLASEKLNLNGRYVTPFSQAETDTALRNDYLKKYGELEESLINKLGQEKYKSLDVTARAKEIDNHIAGLADDVQDEFRRAARFVEIYEKDMSAVMSKVAGKASIGYINTPLASLRRAAATEGFSRDQLKYIQAAADILEQNIISKKHSTDYAISLAQTFRTNLNDMFEGNTAGADGVNKLIRENYSGSMVDKLRTYSDIDLSEVDDEEILNRITSTISDVGRAARNNSNFRNIIKAENAKNTITASNMEDVLSGISERSTGLNKAIAKAKYNGGSTSSVNASINMDGFESSTKKVISSAAEVIDDMARSVSGSGLAKAALGIAGAIMATGYIGGNPTIAPGTEAQDLDSYDSLQDQDLSIQQLPQGTGQGYVININAQSPKGQDHAVKAIQQAMQSSVTTDINIAMSLKDNTSNINRLYIDKLLSGAI